MPNWCMNDFKVSGESSELKRFLDASMGYPAKYPPVYDGNGKILFDYDEAVTEPHFCFNALIPTPQEILDVGFDGYGKNDEYGNPVLDGYNWNIYNWGTKWDIYGDNITLESIGWYEGCESVSFGFDTAWDPPEGWFAVAVRMFPELHFELHYEEPGNYFAGDFDGENGEYWEHQCSDEECKELFAWLEDDEDEVDETPAELPAGDECKLIAENAVTAENEKEDSKADEDSTEDEKESRNDEENSISIISLQLSQR